MLDITNQTSFSIDSTLLESIALELSEKLIEVVFVNDATMQSINKEFLGKDCPTDVLSFPLEDFGGESMPLGSVVINVNKALQISQHLRHTLESEIALLFIHGYLHLVGYDHENDNGEHQLKEEEMVKRFGLPTSLIMRTQG